MFSHTYAIVAKTSILPIPEYYPSFHSTGLPFRPRLVMPLTIPNRYSENFNAPVLEFTAFAKLLNQSVHDSLWNGAFDMTYRLASRVKLEVYNLDGKLSVSITRDKSGNPVETDRGVEKTPLGTFTPPPLRVEDVVFKQISATRFDFSWLVLGRPHWMAEPLFEEVCHRDCVYIWHRVSGQITLEKGFFILKLSMAGSRFPSHALFLNGERKIFRYQGALGNLWVSDRLDSGRVTGSGLSEYHAPMAFGGGLSGGGGAGGKW